MKPQLIEWQSSASLIAAAKVKATHHEIDQDKYEQLVKVYQAYIQDNGEAPGNTFDLINYVQMNGIKGVNFRDIGKFLIHNQQKKQPIMNTTN